MVATNDLTRLVADAAAPMVIAEPDRPFGWGRALAQPLCFLGPGFAMAFSLPTLMGLGPAGTRGAGFAVPLAVALAAAGMAAVVRVVAVRSGRLPPGAGMPDYLADALGPWAGRAAALLYTAGLLALGCGWTVLAGSTVAAALYQETGFGPQPWALWCTVLVAAIWALLRRGARRVTTVQWLLAGVTLTVLVGFSILIALGSVGPSEVIRTLSPGQSFGGFSGLGLGVGAATGLFVGWESAATLGFATKGPYTGVPRAMWVSLAVTAGVMAVLSCAQLAALQFDRNAAGVASMLGGTLFFLAQENPAGTGSDQLRVVVEVAVVLNMVGVLLAISVATVRTVQRVSDLFRTRPSRPPAARTDLRRGATGVMLTFWLGAVTTLAFPGLLAVKGEAHFFAVYTWLATAGTAAILFTYLALCLAAVAGRSAVSPWTAAVGCVSSALGALAPLLDPDLAPPSAVALVLGLLVVLLVAARVSGGSLAGRAEDLA